MSIVRFGFNSMHLPPALRVSNHTTPSDVWYCWFPSGFPLCQWRDRIVSFRYAENTLRIISFGLPWSHRIDREIDRERGRQSTLQIGLIICMSLIIIPSVIVIMMMIIVVVVIAIIDSKGIVKLSTKKTENWKQKAKFAKSLYRFYLSLCLFPSGVSTLKWTIFYCISFDFI